MMAYLRLLQQLPTPKGTWKDSTIDFVKRLPRLEGKYTIMVIVDKFIWYRHFIALAHSFLAQDVAQIFLNHFYKFYEFPATIIIVRDKVFTSIFLRELFKKLGVRLFMSTSNHPKTDGKLERVNQRLETNMWCMTMHKPKRWCLWLSLA